MIVTCSDAECKYYNANYCQAPAVDHTADRFCTAGRRRPKDEHRQMMEHFNSGCGSTNRGYKSNHGKVIK
jgi:hypothetical protein